MQLPPGVSRPPPLHFAPFLSGKRLLTTQTFRDLFRTEVIGGNEGIGVKDIALLFTDLKGSTALYDRIGDLNAFALVQQHFEQLQSVTARHHGAIIKTIGDAIMAAFLNPADAVQAAQWTCGSEIAAFNERQPDKELILKIGVHKGAAIAVTLNDRLDYFGQTVNIAARVQNLADADEIFVSQDVYEAAGVRDELKRLRGRAENGAASRRAARPSGVSRGELVWQPKDRRVRSTAQDRASLTYEDVVRRSAGVARISACRGVRNRRQSRSPQPPVLPRRRARRA